MGVIRTIPWQSYPPIPKLNSSSRQAQNLIGFWPNVNENARNLRDLAGGNHGDISHANSAPIATNIYGGSLGRQHATAGNDTIVVDANAGYGSVFAGSGNNEPFTLSCKLRSDTASTQQYYFSDHSTGGVNMSLITRVESDNTWTVWFYGSSGSDGIWHGSSFAADTTYTLGINIDIGTEIRLFLDGVSVASANISSLGTLVDGSCAVFGSAGLNIGTESWRGWMWDIRIYRGALTADQHLEIHRNPYDIFEPRKIYIPAEAAAAPAANKNFMTLLGVS